MIDHFVGEWKKVVTGLIVVASVTGLSVWADSRWLHVMSFQEWVEEDSRQFDEWVDEEDRKDTLKEIRGLEREINEKSSELKYEDGERAAILEEQINFLELQKRDLERELELDDDDAGI